MMTPLYISLFYHNRSINKIEGKLSPSPETTIYPPRKSDIFAKHHSCQNGFKYYSRPMLFPRGKKYLSHEKHLPDYRVTEQNGLLTGKTARTASFNSDVGRFTGYR